MNNNKSGLSRALGEAPRKNAIRAVSSLFIEMSWQGSRSAYNQMKKSFKIHQVLCGGFIMMNLIKFLALQKGEAKHMTCKALLNEKGNFSRFFHSTTQALRVIY